MKSNITAVAKSRPVKNQNPIRHQSLLLSNEAVSHARQWLSQVMDQKYHQSIAQASPMQVQQAIAETYPNGVNGFLQALEPEEEPVITLEQGLKNAHHRNIHPLGYFYETEGTNMLAQIAGPYLQKTDVQTRVCLLHLASFFIIKQSLPDMTIDSRIPQSIDQELGVVVQDFNPNEWMAVVGTILENTNPDYMNAME